MERLELELGERAIPEPDQYGPFKDFNHYIELYSYLLFGRRMSPVIFQERLGTLNDGLVSSFQAYEFMLAQYPLAKYLVQKAEDEGRGAEPLTIKELWEGVSQPNQLVFTQASLDRDPVAQQSFFNRLIEVTKTWRRTARSEVRSATPGIFQSGLRSNSNFEEGEASLRSSRRKPQSEGGRSEVRVMTDNRFEDEERAYREWENDFERDRRLKGVILHAAVIRYKVRVRSLVKTHGSMRRHVKKILEGYGFEKPAGMNGPYEFKLSSSVHAQLEEKRMILPEKAQDFIRYDVGTAAAEVVHNSKRYLPDGAASLVADEAYAKSENLVFWRSVSPGLAELFRPMLRGETITWRQLRSVVLELWAAVEVVEDIQRLSLNGYHEPLKLVVPKMTLAYALSESAIRAAAERLFTERDLLPLKQLRHDLERLHFQLAKTLIEFERELVSTRSEVRSAVDFEQRFLTESRHGAKAAMISFNDLLTFSSDEIREAAIVLKQRPEVRFIVYGADPQHEKLLSLKRFLSFRNVEWTQGAGEAVFQSLGPKYRESGVVRFSRGGAEESAHFSAESRRRLRQFKVVPGKSGTMAVALSYDPEDPRYRWGLLREGEFYVVADSLASIAATLLNQFVVAVSA